MQLSYAPFLPLSLVEMAYHVKASFVIPQLVVREIVAGMVDNADGEAVAALQLAQEGEQRRHFAAEVLVDETRLQLGDGLVEAGTVGLGRSPRSPSRNVSISSELDPLVTSTQR